MSIDASQWLREPGRGRYARPERERRFVVNGDPPEGAERREIHDVYLEGLRLRLRHVASAGQSVYKLTQKVRVRESDPSDVALTNMYLSEAEFRRLSRLPGSALRKSRRLVPVDGITFAVDEFAGPLQGLRLAEVEVSDLQAELALPSWVGAEVTHDDRFSGGCLASLADAEARELVEISRTLR